MTSEAWEKAVEAGRRAYDDAIMQITSASTGSLVGPDLIAATLRAAFPILAEELFSAIELYGDENIRMANDTIMVDPLLGRARKGTVGRPLTKLEEAISEDCQISGAIHSAKFHAANEIAILLRARIEQMKEQS